VPTKRRQGKGGEDLARFMFLKQSSRIL
jgi:hypothetical protein